MLIQGVYTALVTPFTYHDIVNEKILIALLHRQMAAGIDGITILGSTGEAPTLEDSERDFIVKVAARECKGKCKIMVGCGSPSTKKVIDQAKRAEDLGADSILAITPYCNKPTQEGIFLHFKAVSESVDLPICVYNIPGRTGQNIETSTLSRIADIPTIVSVKEASGNISQMLDVIEKVGHKHSHFSVLSGDDMLALPLIAIGGHGLISVISNLLPKATKRFVDEARHGNITLARAYMYALKPLISACFYETNPIPLKRMLQLAGIDAGPCRLPLCAPTKQDDEKILHTFQDCKHLIEDELKQSLLASTTFQVFE